MLLTTLALGLLMQGPQEVEMKHWVDAGFDASRPSAETVTGEAELSRSEAVTTVERKARKEHRSRLTAMVAERIEESAPFWLPGFVKDRVVEGQVRSEILRLPPKVLDTDVLVRQHSFGQSFQGFLLIDPVRPQDLASDRRLSRRLRREQDWFLMKSGGALGLWILLGIGVLWLDRLTRGYMTKRLYALGAALALVGPALVVVL